MASFSLIFTLVFLYCLMSTWVVSQQQEQQPVLDSFEQESVYQVLSSINSSIPWRSLFPDDLCSSAPHGVVCDYFSDESTNDVSVHITELSFGYVSDFTPNPPCSPNSTLNPLLFTSFKHLRKLFFYKCFTETPVSVPGVSPTFAQTIEELVFIGNPALVGPLSDMVSNFTSLRRLVLTGNGLYGNIPDGVGDLVNSEEITLSMNNLSGEVSLNFSKLKKLKVLDLSGNGLVGNVPERVGNLTQLLKLDLSSNGFSGKIPESLGNLQSLEFMDLSFNRFANFGIPLFLAEMPRLKEVYLSGNSLGGQIPEIWEKLDGILGIGFSSLGLEGKIPASMGVHLKNLCYLGLDNNNLRGKVPEEFEFLEFASEINLENNNLSGRVPFSAKFTSKVGGKLRLKGNPELCIDEDLSSGKRSSSLQQLKLCTKPDIPIHVLPLGAANSGFSSSFSHLLVLFLCFLLIKY
ncbi:hypothetical protein SLEP1_g811 [Rubroshorea leprosula]|uniref:Piriformospora indica-insensitive protein 2 n=1 Tax=Rubroshorea leprosula TaxID=152421 RepID=A0AAV5HKH7_9ROSI|nr:hypothetical protein SLEP1_g811 [Rubroshorea leprosula]